MSSSFLQFSNDRITLVLDGGLGTTLEDVFHKNISHTPLWSAKLINEDPESIIQAHLAFMRAGADTVLTSTYQCSYETFERAGFTPQQAVAAMLKSVHLADEARTRFITENTGVLKHDVKIGLSLGPFGASLSPAQEFDGFYPPPYGPKSYSPSHANINTFGIDEKRLEEVAVEALVSFHLQRLQVFSGDVETWEKLDFIAFETIPLLREITAIKRAVVTLYKENTELDRKPWWISAVFPDGKLPQHGATVEQVARTMLDDSNGIAVPDGIGINCTQIEYMPGLLEDMNGYLDSNGVSLWLVLYPNGGDVYDPVSQTWNAGETASAKNGDVWAAQLSEIVEHCGSRFSGVIVGGCCKTGPEKIEALAKRLGR